MQMFYHVRVKKKYLYAFLMGVLLLLLAYFINEQVLQHAFQASPLDAIYGIDTRENMLVFTFEAAAGEDYIEEILGVLSRYGIRALFFVTGHWLEENRELAAKLAAKHEVGSHTYSHPRLLDQNNDELAREFERFQELFEDVFGEDEELRYFRPPFGEFDERTLALAGEKGQKVVLWSIESQDWMASSLDRHIDDLLQKIHPGGIVAFRAGSKETVMTLPLFIQSVWKEGYQIVPLDWAIDEYGGAF